MNENAQWVPQGIPQKSQDSKANQGPIPPQVPNANSNNKLPWFLWFAAGCGCLGFVIIPILIVLFIVVINPTSKIYDTENSLYTKELSNTGKAINDCIEAEKSKGTDLKKIYSAEICANKDYLFDNHYSSIQLWSELRVSTNISKSKICAYITYYDYKSKEDLITSWDTEKGISEVGKGTKVCSDTKVKEQTATNSATTSAK